MNEIIFDEMFDEPEMEPGLEWLNPPQNWEIDMAACCLIVRPDPETDFWQETHYGLRADNGHFLFAEIAGDFILTTRVRFYPQHCFDQAGLMVRISPQCWIKTSVEYEPGGINRLGAVVTNNGYSDWSTQDFPSRVEELMFRIRREGADYMVEVSEMPTPTATSEPARGWFSIRLAHLAEDDGKQGVMAGIYACSPTESGFMAEFDFLKIERGKLAK